jgi:hypothetical protein
VEFTLESPGEWKRHLCAETDGPRARSRTLVGSAFDTYRSLRCHLTVTQ